MKRFGQNPHLPDFYGSRYYFRYLISDRTFTTSVLRIPILILWMVRHTEIIIE